MWTKIYQNIFIWTDFNWNKLDGSLQVFNFNSSPSHTAQLEKEATNNNNNGVKSINHTRQWTWIVCITFNYIGWETLINFHSNQWMICFRQFWKKEGKNCENVFFKFDEFLFNEVSSVCWAHVWGSSVHCCRAPGRYFFHNNKWIFVNEFRYWNLCLKQYNTHFH